MTNQGKQLTKLNPRYVRVFQSLPWLLNKNLCLKIIKYKNIFLSLKNIYCGMGLSWYITVVLNV